MTPPAVALNLVCTALFDKTRYLGDEGAWDSDLALRIMSVYMHLLNLWQDAQAGQLTKCSAGLQHDLLYLLRCDQETLESIQAIRMGIKL